MDLLAVISYPPIPIFEVGPLRLSLHGVFAGVGFMAGAYYGLKMFHARGFDAARFQSALTWALIGALLGARWLTLPAYWVENGFDLSEMINIGGNYSIMGGFAGGIGLGVFRAYRLGLRIWPTLDVTAFGLAIGTIVGRIGDLAIVEHLGGPTDFFLGYGIRPGYDVAPQHNRLECTVAEVGEYCGIYHHAAFYDMLGAIVLFAVLYWLYERSRLTLRYGQLFAVWVAWYGFQRLFIDFTRLALDVDGDRTLGALTWSQWSGLAAGIAGVAGLLWLGRRNRAVSLENDRLYGAATTAPEPEPD
jgi:prolipoprotein diacylglyceryltransferase